VSAVVDMSKPIISETGYRSYLWCSPGMPLGRTLDKIDESPFWKRKTEGGSVLLRLSPAQLKTLFQLRLADYEVHLQRPPGLLCVGVPREYTCSGRLHHYLHDLPRPIGLRHASAFGE
jgi:hypothetical protein